MLHFCPMLLPNFPNVPQFSPRSPNLSNLGSRTSTCLARGLRPFWLEDFDLSGSRTSTCLARGLWPVHRDHNRGNNRNTMGNKMEKSKMEKKVISIIFNLFNCFKTMYVYESNEKSENHIFLKQFFWFTNYKSDIFHFALCLPFPVVPSLLWLPCCGFPVVTPPFGSKSSGQSFR